MWKSVDDMVRDLGLPASPDAMEAVEKVLKQQLAMLHPDITGGRFASDRQEARYHRTREGLEFIKGGTIAPPALRTTDIEKIVQATVLALKEVPRQSEHARANVLENVLLDLQRANRAPSADLRGVTEIRFEGDRRGGDGTAVFARGASDDAPDGNENIGTIRNEHRRDT
jgi:hypothetical protein